MSVTNSRRIAQSRPSVDYVMFGPLGSETYQAHIANGTDRAAAMRCDCGSPFEFVELAEQLRETYGRKVEAISIIQSFESSELDPKVPAYVQLINDCGYHLAKRLAHRSYVLVVTHTDSAGGHGHNHIFILNHDNETGKALRRDFRHFAVAEVNDELMREHSMRVVETGSRDQTKYWEHMREGETIAAFDKLLGDRLMEVRLDQTWSDQAGYEAALAAVGITIKEERHTVAASADGATPEHESIGWTYRMLDDTGVDDGIKPRMRRRKASSIGAEFTHKSVQAQIDERQAQHAAKDAAEAQQAAQPALSALQTEWLERVSKGYDSAFDARMAMTRAGVDVADQNAVMAAWQAEQARVSGYPVVDQGGQPQTPEIDQDGGSIDSPRGSKPRSEPTSGSQPGRAIPDVGSEAEQIAAEDPETTENGPNPTSPTRSTTALPTRGHSEPTSGRQADSKRSQGGSTIDEQPDLELLTLRYRAATEGASWSDDEYDAALARMDELKAQLGIPSDAAVPTRDAVIAEYERRVLGAEPSSGTPSAPPGLADVNEEGPLAEGTEPDLAPAASGPSPAAPALVDQPVAEPPAPPGLVDAGSPVPPGVGEPAEPYRSAVRELADETDDPKAKAVFESIARFDEESREVLMAGGRIGNADVVKVSKGTGDRWQRAQARLDPIVRHEMLLRAERMAERREAFESGKALKARLEQFGQPGFTLDEYRDTESRLAESNAEVRLLEARMNAGIYEEGSKWRPGRPIPDRVRSRSMTARLHELDEHDSIDAGHRGEDRQPGS